MLNADGKQDIRAAHLDNAQGGDGGHGRQGKIRFPKAQRRKNQARCKLAQKTGGNGVGVFARWLSKIYHSVCVNCSSPRSSLL
jgi:hypothetical protein